MQAAHGPIGVFDSGVGGLSVWREIVRALPGEDTLYFADQVHVPYGPRGEAEIRGYCDAITRYLLDRHCKAIVVACNTASAAALKHLREQFPGVPTIGMEPAVKPAAALTRNGVVGILATPATFEGRLFKATAGRHAAGIRLVNQVCTGLAEHVEAGDLTGPATDEALRGYLAPVLAAGADTLVLACSHYPFVIESIRRIAGPGVTVIDPAPAVARHLATVLGDRHLLRDRAEGGRHTFVTSGPAAGFATAVRRLTGHEATATEVHWTAGPVPAVA